MVRGAGKAQAQAKAQAKASSQKSGKSQLKDRETSLKISCPICKTAVPHYNMLKTHWDSKHSSQPIPSEESFKN